VYGGGRRIDPSGGCKHQYGKQPKTGDADEKPSNERAEGLLPKQPAGAFKQSGDHISR